MDTPKQKPPTSLAEILAAAQTIGVTGAADITRQSNYWPTLQERIEFFFTPPTVNESSHRVKDNIYSTLYLLRRELQRCYIGNRDMLDEQNVRNYAKANPDTRASLATTMLLLSGFDLLGKFSTPRETFVKKRTSVRTRFTHFASMYCYNGNNDEANALYGIRCALLHTFGLRDDREQTPPRQFELTYDPNYTNPYAIRHDQGVWKVDIGQLYEDFIRALSTYRSSLDSGNIDLQTNFDAAFSSHGQLRAS